MRFPADALLLTLIGACACGATAGTPSTAAPSTSPSTGPSTVPSAVPPAARSAGSAPPAALGSAVTPEEVRAAAAKLRADPNLGGQHKIRSLRWNKSRAPEEVQKPPAWIEGLFEYLGQTGSALLWVAGAIAAAIAVVWAYRTFEARTPRQRPVAAPAIARIGGMDIRPESLPADIGPAALALAEAGKTREALSLLYRGALSRAVHRFGVPIGESFTEGEALVAVGARLDAPRLSYFSDLVGVWRRAVYAGESMPGETVGRLCRGFTAALDATAPDPAGA